LPALVSVPRTSKSVIKIPEEEVGNRAAGPLKSS